MSLSDQSSRAADHPDPDNEVLAGARERVTALLTDRYAERTLTLDEFEARMERLRSAKTAAELNSLMRDLTVLPADAGGTAAEGAAAVLHDAAPATGRLLSILSETKRSGYWVVPRRLDMRVIAGNVLLDLRDAVLPVGETEVALMGVLGRVRVLVRPGVVVDTTLASIVSTVRNDAEPDPARPFAASLIRITGDAVLTEVMVRVAPAGERAERAWRQAKLKRPS